MQGAKSTRTDREKTLFAAAEESLAGLFAYWIRQKLDENPDHSGPEDQADAFAVMIVRDAITHLEAIDYRDIQGRESNDHG